MLRITVVRLAVGKGELRALDDGVQVVGRVVAHALQVEAVEQAELLQEHRSLRPRTALVHIDPAEVDAARRLRRRTPRCHVVHGQQPGVLLAAGVEQRVGDEADDALGDRTAVERVARRLDAALAPAAGRLLGGHHRAQRRREVRVAEPLAHARDAAAGAVDRRRGGIALQEQLRLVLGAAAEGRIDRKALFGQLYGGGQDVREAQAAETRHRARPSVQGRRHAGRQVAVTGNQVDAVLPAVVDGERRRRATHAADRERFALRRRIDEGRRLAADPVRVWLQQVQADAHRRRRVDGVAAPLHDVHAGRRGQIVPGRDHVAAGHDLRAGREVAHVPSSFSLLRSERRPRHRPPPRCSLRW